jgi:preprotein translocase subunit SecD
VNTSSGIPSSRIGPDPVFASYPSTPAQDDRPAASVLFPADPAAGAQQYPRFVLGASQFGNPGIATVRARHDQASDQWVIAITLTHSGATAWNAVALLNFHAYVAFVLDGQVLSAPLIEPNQTGFASFGALMEIAGNFTAAGANDLAAVLGSGSLPVPFTLQSETTVR